MDKNILSTTDFIHHRTASTSTLFYQDTDLVVELLQLSHQQYAKQGRLDEQSFMAFLEEFLESIEKICEKNKDMPVDYYLALIEFHRYMKNHAWQCTDTLVPLFHVVACLVQYAVESFYRCYYPAAGGVFVSGAVKTKAVVMRLN